MEWTIEIKGTQYIEVVTRGAADGNGSMAMARAITAAMREHEIKKALIDHSNIDAVSGEIVDVYHRPKQFRKMGIIPGLAIAEVVKPEHKEFFDFLETVCINRGFGFATFHDRESALRWLLEE